MKRGRRMGLLLFMWSMLLVGCNRAEELIKSIDLTSSERISIAYLKACCQERSHPIREAWQIEGVVTANDLYGEFPYALVIEDASEGIEIRLHREDLYRRYPIGTRLLIHCQGLALGNYGGRILLGAKPTGSFVVDGLTQEEEMRHINLLSSGEKPLDAMPIQIAEAKNHTQDRYVELQAVSWVEQGFAWCDYDSEQAVYLPTERHLTDQDGNRLVVRIAATCHYAAEEIPQGSGTVKGILSTFNHTPQLQITRHEIYF